MGCCIGLVPKLRRKRKRGEKRSVSYLALCAHNPTDILNEKWVYGLLHRSHAKTKKKKKERGEKRSVSYLALCAHNPTVALLPIGSFSREELVYPLFFATTGIRAWNKDF